MLFLLKPEHGKKILGSEGRRGFSPKAEYIFLKQLEEADAIVINKIDKLTDQEQANLLQQVNEKFPDVPAIHASAREGTNWDQFAALFDQPPRERHEMMEVDYETYAIGEAEMGWFNCKIDVQSQQKFALDDLALQLVENIGSEISGLDCEIAHLKVIGQTLNDAAVANLVNSGGVAELSLASEIKTASAELLVNARVAASPDQLKATVAKAAKNNWPANGGGFEDEQHSKFSTREAYPHASRWQLEDCCDHFLAEGRPKGF